LRLSVGDREEGEVLEDRLGTAKMRWISDESKARATEVKSDEKVVEGSGEG
jgi:hypothetical protein